MSWSCDNGSLILYSAEMNLKISKSFNLLSLAVSYA